MDPSKRGLVRSGADVRYPCGWLAAKVKLSKRTWGRLNAVLSAAVLMYIILAVGVSLALFVLAERAERSLHPRPESRFYKHIGHAQYKLVLN